jgi:tRNA(Arg) A34 adenosine deaminase TadA
MFTNAVYPFPAGAMCDGFDLMNSIFYSLTGRRAVLDCAMPEISRSGKSSASSDEVRMRELKQLTMRTMSTSHPTPFGALIVNTRTGERLMRATNAVMRENDPSSHAELRTVRLACKKLKRTSLAGFTMYSTCEPCPMCMANALWAGLDRVVFGATIADANRHCLQIQIPAKEVARRSDIKCLVEGPVLRELCIALFTHPNMLRAFKTWSTSKQVARRTR